MIYTMILWSWSCLKNLSSESPRQWSTTPPPHKCGKVWNQDGRWCVPQIFQRFFRPRHWLPGRVTRCATLHPVWAWDDLTTEAQKSFPNSPPPNSCWKDDTKYIIYICFCGVNRSALAPENEENQQWFVVEGPQYELLSGDPTRRGRDGLENDWWLNAWVSMDHCKAMALQWCLLV